MWTSGARTIASHPKNMRSSFPKLRLLAFGLLLVSLAASAQDEDVPSLGDFARNLRKNKTQTSPQQATPDRPVIDNDNLSQVMEDAKRARPVKADKTVF